MEKSVYKVYVKTKQVGETACVVAIQSEKFLKNLAGWTQIDEGEGDRYVHAQSNYLLLTPEPMKGLFDEKGRCNYQLVNGGLVLLGEQQKAALFPPEMILSPENRISTLEAQLTDTQLALCESYEDAQRREQQLTATQLALVDVYEALISAQKGGELANG